MCVGRAEQSVLAREDKQHASRASGGMEGFGIDYAWEGGNGIMAE
jgi:hypothetical protein